MLSDEIAHVAPSIAPDNRKILEPHLDDDPQRTLSEPALCKGSCEN